MVKVNNRNTQNDVNDVTLESLSLNFKIHFIYCSSLSAVDFEQVNICSEDLELFMVNNYASVIDPAGTDLLKLNNRNTKTRCEIYLELTVKTLERRQWRSLDLLASIYLLTLFANLAGKKISCGVFFSEVSFQRESS